MTFTDITIIYCEKDMKCTNALPGKIQTFPVYSTWYMSITFIIRLMHSIIQNLEVKIYVV